MRIDIARNEVRELLRVFHEMYPDEAQDNHVIADLVEGESNLGEIIAAILQEVELDKERIMAVKRHIATLQDRISRLENRIERQKNMCLNTMLDLGLEKLNTSLGTIGTRTSSKLIVTEPEMIPDQYFIEKVTRILDKTKVKEAIDNGEQIKGAHMSNGERYLVLRK